MERFEVTRGRARQRMVAWNRVGSETFGEMTVSSPEPDTFEAMLTRVALGDISVARVRSDPSTIRGGTDRTSSDPQHIVLLCERGHLRIEQADRSIDLDEGDLTLLSTAEPYTIEVPVRHTCNVATVPAAIDGVHWDLAVMRRTHRSEVPVLAALLDQAAPHGREGSPPATSDLRYSTTLARIFRDAMILTWPVPATDDVAQLRSDHWLRKIDQEIVRNLVDPDLGAASIGRSLGISSRYVQRIMSRRGTTVSRHILEMRLIAAAERLRDEPLTPITRIAFDVGFGDLSHFSRTFKARFGLAPRTWRHSAR